MAKFIITDRLEEEQAINNALDELLIDLMTKQEPLGKEFEKVLNDNLWDLYSESEED